MVKRSDMSQEELVINVSLLNKKRFCLNNYTCKDCNACKLKFEHCSSIVSSIVFRVHKRVQLKKDLPKVGYFNKEPGSSCKHFFLFFKLEASCIDIDDLEEISKEF